MGKKGRHNAPRLSPSKDEVYQSIDIAMIQDSLGNEVEGEDVIEVLRDFYAELYKEQNIHSPEDIESF